MNDVIVYLSAILFFISVLPIHVFSYIYISTGQKYAGVNISIYRYFTILRFNTDKKFEFIDKNVMKKQMNTTLNWLTVYNNLCITKIVQLADFGLKKENNAYIALGQNAVTNALYSFVKINGGRTKLKNYAILNSEHSEVNYYLKLVGVINLIVVTKLLLIYLWSKINEQQIKKKSKRNAV